MNVKIIHKCCKVKCMLHVTSSALLNNKLSLQLFDKRGFRTQVFTCLLKKGFLIKTGQQCSNTNCHDLILTSPWWSQISFDSLQLDVCILLLCKTLCPEMQSLCGCMLTQCSATSFVTCWFQNMNGRRGGCFAFQNVLVTFFFTMMPGKHPTSTHRSHNVSIYTCTMMPRKHLANTHWVSKKLTWHIEFYTV